MKRVTTAILALVGTLLAGSDGVGASQQEQSKHTIVPGVRVGEYTIDMSKDEVLKKLGEPDTIHLGKDEVVRRGEKKYSLDNLPNECVFSFGDISFSIDEDSVEAIFVRSPLYKLSNGLKVGDSEQKMKQAFGEDFHVEEALGRTFLCKHAKGLAFSIHKKNQTVVEIVVYQPEGDRGDRDAPDSAEVALVRKAAAEGRILYRLTTPQEFKEVAGKPTRQWTGNEGESSYMEYPGVTAKFVGRGNSPHVVTYVLCNREGIDIGENRPVVLRNEGDLQSYVGLHAGYSGLDLSRLDLSQKGDLVEPTLFDSRTVWPKPGLLPPGFEPRRRLEEGKNPGLGVRSLHQEGINGSGVGIAIIDQPLLKDHIEYADRIKSYHAMEVEGVDPQMHGPAVCSIAVGKSCGVAPQANLHYYAKHPGKWQENRPYVRTVEQILERNRDLPQSEKVRVISISLGMFPAWDNYDQWQAVVDKAKKNGVLVVTCDEDYMQFLCIKRIVGKDPDDPNSYGPGRLYGDGNAPLYVPDSYRTIASADGKDIYTFDTWGGMSWAVPYLAGLAALAFQVHPEISPDQIVELWKKTATPTKIGPVVNPRGFIEAVKRLKRGIPR